MKDIDKKLIKMEKSKRTDKKRVINKKLVTSTGIGLIVVILLGILLFNAMFNNTQQMSNKYNPELAVAMEYPRVTAGEENVPNTNYVKFDAFFLKDLDGDGYADKIRGTCLGLSDTDTLYLNLNVLTNGTLENGHIEIQGKNINFKTAIVEDDVILGDYISENTTEINLKNVKRGTQKLIYGTIKAPSLDNDTKKYSSKINKVILTGTHRADNGQTTAIRKEINFTVDWHASVSCNIYNSKEAQDVSKAVDRENGSVNLSFYIGTKEEKNEAILKSSYLSGTIPPLNGYMPIKVEITGADITSTYDYNTGNFEITKLSEINSNKVVTKAVPRDNTYDFNVMYPIQAYDELGSDTISIQIPVQAYYEGYNNENKEFENPIKSNIATETLCFLWRKGAFGGIARFDVTVGTYRKFDKQYVVSKREPLKLYNKTEEQTYDTYKVDWYASIGSDGNGYSIRMKEQPQEKDEDRLLNSENQWYDMSAFTKNIGIYFSGASLTLGDNGEIRVYNADNEQLLHTFTKDDWGKYNDSTPFMYGTPVTHIKVETSSANRNTELIVHNIKEINDAEVVSKFGKTEFDKLQYIYSYLDGDVKAQNGNQYTDINMDENFALYEAPISVATIDITKDIFGTQKEEEDVNITIKADASGYNMEKWKNGKFLVELPKEVLDIKINSIISSDKSVNILAHEIYEQQGQKFIQIETENETPTNYDLVINCNLTADPRITTQTKPLKLYAINENNENYKNAINDTYDIDGDLNIVEKINYAEDDMYFISPSSLITDQQATNYNNNGDIVVAPQVAMIDKKEAHTATIKVNIKNDYGSTVSEVKIVGKIPTKGNTYVIDGESLGSTYNTTMQGAMTIPEELKQYVTVYYSDKEDATADLEDEYCNWTQTPDFTKVKSYLIDFGNYKLSVGEERSFSYNIEIPTGVKYNDISYSTHAVYFCLDTTGGKFKTETETSKLGFSIERKYNLVLKKLRQGMQTAVQGAVFTVKEENTNDSKIGTTNGQGTFTIKDLYVDRTYILEEVRTPNSFEKNTVEYKFKVKVSESTDELVLEPISGQGTIKTANIVQAREENKGALNIDVENIPKYQIVLTKKEKNSANTIPGATYNIKGGNLGSEGITIATDGKGKLTVLDLSREVEYTITEISAEGYYVDETPRKFKLTNNGGTLQFKTLSGTFTNTNVVIGTGVSGTEALDKVELELQDEKIPTYSVTLKKYAKDKDTTLNGAQFKIEGEGIKAGGEILTTSDAGTITINGLYEYIASKPKITGIYTVTEITPPQGYSLNTTPLKFKAQKNGQNLELKVISGSEFIRSVGSDGAKKQDITVTGSSIQIGLQDEPLFKITKVEKGTKTPIPNTKFRLIELNERYVEQGPARDINGEEVGELETINGKTIRVVTTDEEGVISYGLRSGLYKAVEVQPADGYILSDNEQSRTYYFGIDVSKAQETKQGVSWANEVASGNWNKVESAKKTQDEGIITVGYFSGKLDLNGDGVADLTGKNNDYNGFIAKYNGDGSLQFAKKVSCDENTKIKDIIVTQDREYIVVGYFNYGSLKVDEQQTGLTNTTLFEKGFVMKFTADGTYSWSKEIAEANKNVKAVSVVENGNKNIIVGANTDGNAKIVEYNQSGNEQNRAEIQDTVDIEDMTTNLTNTSIIVISSGKEATETSTTGRIDTYQNGAITSNATVDFNPSAITKLNTGRYIIVGNYLNRSQEVESSGDYDSIILQYDGNSALSNAKFIKGNLDDIVTSVEATKDGGFLVGAYTHSSTVDFNNDGNNEIQGKVGNTEALVLKYDNSGNYSSYKQISGSEMQQVTDVVERKENEFVAVGYFNSQTVSANKPNSYEINLNRLKYTDGFILNYGEIVTAPEIPQKTNIEVENELKKYVITTEVKLLQGQSEKGGSITGDSAGVIETVQHGKNSTSTIQIQPNSGYKILSITINDEEYPFTVEQSGTGLTLPNFTNMTSNKHIVVTFSNTVSSIIVHHYLDGTQTNPQPTKVSDDETKTGNIGEYYTTAPHTELERYDLKRKADNQYDLPTNKSGTYTQNVQEVTYLYVERKVPLTVHHYLEGTQTPVTLANGSRAQDVITQENIGTAYTTQALKPYDDGTETDRSKKLAEKYELCRTPTNAQGQYQYPGVEVTYEYRIKSYNVITKVKTHTELDKYDNGVQVKGGKILGEGQTPYEKVLHGESNELPITATPDSKYRIKGITLNDRPLVEGTDYTVNIADGSITLKTIKNITQDQIIVVEFEKEKTDILVTKEWNHENNVYEKPTKAEVKLIDVNHPERILGTVELSAANGYTHTFTGLEKYYNNDEEIIYTVIEEETDGENPIYYEPVITTGEGSIKVVNTFIGPVISQNKTYEIIAKDGSKVTTRDYVMEQEKIRYTITVTNEGQIERDVAIKDEIPAGTTFVEGSIKINGNESYELKDGSLASEKTQANLRDGITVTVPPRAQKENGQIVLSFEVIANKIAEGAGYAKDIYNTAVVEDGSIDKTEQEKEASSDKVTEKKPHITISKASAEGEKVSYAKPGRIAIGDEIIYTITVRNDGEAPGTVNIKDKIPTATVYKDESLSVTGQLETEQEYTIDQLTGEGIEVTVPEKEGEVVVQFSVIVTGMKTVEVEGTEGPEEQEVELDNEELIVNSATVEKNLENPNIEKETETTNEVENVYVKPIISENKTLTTQYGFGYVVEDEIITYAVVVYNAGGLAKDVKIQDIIPDGTTFIPESIRVNGNTMYREEDYSTKTAENLEEGIIVYVPEKENGIDGQTILSFKVSVNKLPDGILMKQIRNTAIVDDRQTNEKQTMVNKTDIEFKKTSNPETGSIVRKGDEITYTIEAENKGTAAQDIVIRDDIPEGTEFVEDSLTITRTIGENYFKYGKADLERGIEINLFDGEKLTLEFKVKVKNIKDGDKIKNVAVINGIPSNETEHTYSEAVISGEKIAETTNKKAYVIQGEQITYTIKLKNEGTTAGYAIVKDTIPARTTFVEGSIKVNGESSYEIGSKLNHEGKELEPKTEIDLSQKTPEYLEEGIKVYVPEKTYNAETSRWENGEVTVSFDVTVNEETEGDVRNKAVIDKDPTNPDDPDLDDPDNPKEPEEPTNEVVIPVVTYEKESAIIERRKPELALEENEASVGDKIKYTIRISNTGSIDVENIEVKDNIPDGVEIINIENEGHLEDGIITWQIAQVQANSEKTVSFTVKVKYTRDEYTIANIATVDGKETNETENPYKKPDPQIESQVDKTGTEKITTKDSKVYYEIRYNAQVDEFVGKARITIVDTLPYPIDTEDENLILDEGEYEEVEDLETGETKYTVTWVQEIDPIDTFEAGEAKEISITKVLGVNFIYGSLNDNTGSMENKVDAKIELLEPITKEDPDEPDEPTEYEKVKEDNKEDTHDTSIEIPAKVVVHHYIYDEELQEETDVSIAPDVTMDGFVGREYTTTPSEEVPANYTCKNAKPDKYEGKFTEEDIEVTYYYSLTTPEVTNEVEKTATVVQTDPDGSIGDSPQLRREDGIVTYTIRYKATIKDYIGKAVIEIVDTLPYAIDTTKAEVDLDGGEYNAENNTITWLETIEGIDTYANKDVQQENEEESSQGQQGTSEEQGEGSVGQGTDEEQEKIQGQYENGTYTIEIVKEIKVVYVDQDVTKDIVNEVTGKTNLYYPENHPGKDPEDELVTEEATDDEVVKQKYKANLRVEKIWQDNDNLKQHRPESVMITIKEKNSEEIVFENMEGLDEEVKEVLIEILSEEGKTVELSEENNWLYEVTDLPKYDETGRKLEYVVTESEVNENDLEYYEEPEIVNLEDQTDEATNYVVRVKNAYKLFETDLNTELTKDGPEQIHASREILNYKIHFTAEITDYIGESKVILVDTLPYEIDEEKPYDLAGGTYDRLEKTITWEDDLGHINVGKEGTYLVDITKEISLVYKDLDATQEEMINEVKGRIELYETEQKDEKETTYETDININGKVIVRYVDIDSKEDITYKEIDENGQEQVKLYNYEIEEKVGTDYETEQKEIENYIFVEHTGNIQGKVTEEEQEVIYYYTRVPAKVIVKYQDEEGNPLDEDETILGQIWDPYTTEEKEFEDYILEEVKGNKEGTMEETEQEVVYVYRRIPAKVVVRYLEKDTEEVLAEELIIEGLSGYNYETERKPIENYRSAEPEPENATGKMKVEKDLSKKPTEPGYIVNDTIIVTYYYEKIPSGTVKVKHVDIDTREDITYTEEHADGTIEEKTYGYDIEGYVGDKYETKPEDIPYYNLVKVPENAEGELTEEEDTVIYYYEKKPFNFSVEKVFRSVILNGEVKDIINNKSMKVELVSATIPTAKLQVTYKIIVKNTGEIDGKAKVVEMLPEGYRLVNIADYWNQISDVSLEAVVELKAGEEKELEVTTEWINGESNFGIFENTVKVVDVENPANFAETSEEDNTATAELITSIKTGIEVNIISILTIISLTILLIILIYVYKREKKMKFYNKNW